MKITLVYRGHTIKKGGGMERRFARIFNTLKNKLDIDFITRSCLANDYYELGLTKNKIIKIKSNILPLEIYSFFKEISSNKSEIVHFIDMGLYNFALSLLIKTFSPKTKIIVSLCDSQIIYTKNIRNLFLRKYFLKIANAIDSLYPAINKIERSSKITVAPCSIVDTDKFKPQKNKEKIIYFCGRMERSKNPILLLKAVKKIAPLLNEKGWKVVIVGGGSLEKAVNDYIKSEKLSSIVSHIIRGDVSSLASQSSIFLSLQKEENYPSQSLLEAMSCENAIIATDVGDTRRLVKNNVNGLLVRAIPNDVAQAIANIVNNETYFSMGRESRRIASDHSALRYCNYLIKIYKEIAPKT
ncbi:MAG: glycosyltransferase family 4 protein [Dethiosulfovibrio sp.]|nr:glycosyltransferase family 4 protein [Dethiosulfovibrio sp.]